MKLIAHRGLRTDTIKENTIEAFQNAINNKEISGFEFDIRKTKDLCFVVNHNALIKGDFIKKRCLRYLKCKYDLPTLEEVLSLETDKIMLVEIKDMHIPYRKLIKILRKHQDKNIYVMSFHNKVIEKLKKRNAPAKLGILNYVLNSEADYNLDFICLLNNLATPHLVEEYKKRGVEVFLYGVINEEKDLFYERGTYIVDYVPKNREK